MIIVSDTKIVSGIFNDTTHVTSNLEGDKYVYCHAFTQAEQDTATGLGARVYADTDDWKTTESWTDIPMI